MKDLMGKAIKDYYFNKTAEDIVTETTISEVDRMPVSYFFREFNEMPLLEKKALELASGRVLDVGAAAGAHSLYLQNEKKLAVVALDISENSTEICRLRGVKEVICKNLLELDEMKFDTILLLMNGTGIFENYSKIDKYLQKLNSLLEKDGQVLIDGTDLLYMYGQEDGPVVPEDYYYGEVDFFVSYKGEDEDPFEWLYLDYYRLRIAAEKNGFKVDKIAEVEYSYLARLQKIS